MSTHNFIAQYILNISDGEIIMITSFFFSIDKLILSHEHNTDSSILEVGEVMLNSW